MFDTVPHTFFAVGWGWREITLWRRSAELLEPVGQALPATLAEIESNL